MSSSSFLRVSDYSDHSDSEIKSHPIQDLVKHQWNEVIKHEPAILDFIYSISGGISRNVYRINPDGEKILVYTRLKPRPSTRIWLFGGCLRTLVDSPNIQDFWNYLLHNDGDIDFVINWVNPDILTKNPYKSFKIIKYEVHQPNNKNDSNSDEHSPYESNQNTHYRIIVNFPKIGDIQFDILHAILIPTSYDIDRLVVIGNGATLQDLVPNCLKNNVDFDINCLAFEVITQSLLPTHPRIISRIFLDSNHIIGVMDMNDNWEKNLLDDISNHIDEKLLVPIDFTTKTFDTEHFNRNLVYRAIHMYQRGYRIHPEYISHFIWMLSAITKHENQRTLLEYKEKYITSYTSLLFFWHLIELIPEEDRLKYPLGSVLMDLVIKHCSLQRLENFQNMTGWTWKVCKKKRLIYRSIRTMITHCRQDLLQNSGVLGYLKGKFYKINSSDLEQLIYYNSDKKIIRFLEYLENNTDPRLIWTPYHAINDITLRICCHSPNSVKNTPNKYPPKPKTLEFLLEYYQNHPNIDEVDIQKDLITLYKIALGIKVILCTYVLDKYIKSDNAKLSIIRSLLKRRDFYFTSIDQIHYILSKIDKLPKGLLRCYTKKNMILPESVIPVLFSNLNISKFELFDYLRKVNANSISKLFGKYTYGLCRYLNNEFSKNYRFYIWYCTFYLETFTLIMKLVKLNLCFEFNFKTFMSLSDSYVHHKTMDKVAKLNGMITSLLYLMSPLSPKLCLKINHYFKSN